MTATMSMSPSDADALLAHKTWRTLEPLHGMIYFVPEAAEAYLRLGITGRTGYFASRAAPMGAVTADVVIATFFNFNPELVRGAIPTAWDVATPADLVEARFTAVDAAYRRILGEDVVGSKEMARAAELAQIAGRRGSDSAMSRAVRSLRRTRNSNGRPSRTCGSGTPSRSCASSAATATSPSSSTTGRRASRRWSPTPRRRRPRPRPAAPPGVGPDDAWQAAVEGLRRAGVGSSKANHSASPRGGAAEHRKEIEEGTDALAAPRRTQSLGEERCAELRAPGASLEQGVHRAPALRVHRSAGLPTLSGPPRPRPVGARP